MKGLLVLAMFAGEPEAFLDWMNKIATQQLDKRAEQIKSITDTKAADSRRQFVREKLLEFMGGLPDYRGALNTKTIKTLDRGSFIVENVVYESLPNFHVSANLYRPAAPGKYPAVLYSMGHWDSGKANAQVIAANLALKGFVVLAYDPLGQGERAQAYDRRLRNTLIGASTEQHNLVGAQALLAGQALARYMIWDGMRGLDLLASRPDVDPNKLGAAGCSGGGTLTTYIAALDPRVKVAAPACYMNSFRHLFAGPLGDAEQTFPNMLAAGLDQADYVAMFAPKPWLISSTEGDYFIPASAKAVYEDAKGLYKLYGAEESISWVLAAGGHGTPRKIREAIYAWMIRWLKDGQGSAAEQKIDLVPDHLLWASEDGHLASRDLSEIVRESLPPKAASAPPVQSFLQGLLKANSPQGHHVELLGTESAGSPKPLLIVVDPARGDREDAAKRASEGTVVAIVTYPGMAVRNDRPYSGNWMNNTRAGLIGRNLPAMRARAILEAIDRASKDAPIDTARVTARASGVAGMWLLMAAAVDSRISEVHLDKTPASLRSAFDSPVHRNLHDAVIPGFAVRWDFDDLRKAVSPRKVIWRNPTDWLGNVVVMQGDYEYTSSDPNQFW